MESLLTKPTKCCSYGLKPYTGKIYEGVVLVGIAPAKEEEKQHVPFVGTNGKMLNSLLDACGWDREKCFLTNIMCHEFWEPTVEDTLQCRPRFDSEMKQAKPKLIISFGGVTCQALLGEKISRVRGIPIWSNQYNCYIMACNQPVAMLNDVNVLYDLVRDFKKIPEVINWKPFGAQGNILYEVVNDAQAVLNSIPAGSLCTVDIECNPKLQDADIYANRMLCLALCWDGQTGHVFPYETIKDCKWPLNRGIRWGYQQGQYDIQGILRYLGIELSLDEDSLLCSYALDERTPRALNSTTVLMKKGIHGLKAQAREFEGAGFYEDEVENSWKTGEFDYEKLHLYNARDAVYTWRLINRWLPKLHEDNVYNLYHDLLLPAARMFTRLQYRGIGFDPIAAGEIITYLAEKEEDLQDSIQEQAEDAGFPGYINTGSWQQLSKLLYTYLSIEHPGAPSTKREILEEIDHPIVDEILALRTTSHMKSAYVLGPIEDLKSDLRLHPDVLINGTVSGRLAYKNPPVGTLPKTGVDDEYLIVRKMYRAQPGYVLLEADYAQIEMRIAAYKCGDPNLLHDLSQPVSVHLLTAGRILNKPPEEVTEYEKVQRGKKVNFGILYGIGARALSNRRTGMNCSVEVAQESLRAWHRNYSHYQPWADDLIKYVRKHGEVQTVTGRKRRVPAIINEKQKRQIINFDIQSPAGDYTLTSMIELEPLLLPYESWPWFINHDSITFELKEDTLHKTLPLIREVMEKPRFPGWPSIPVEMKLGYNMLEMVGENKWR